LALISNERWHLWLIGSRGDAGCITAAVGRAAIQFRLARLAEFC
jgi:hypothetical protein